jgi:hypothetical protein
MDLYFELVPLVDESGVRTELGQGEENAKAQEGKSARTTKK